MRSAAGLSLAVLALWALTLAGTSPSSAQGAEPYPELGLANPIGPANATLYFHINGFQEFPINTQKPADWYKDNAGIGLSTSSTSCGGLTAGTPADREHHTWYGYSSPGYVEYEFTPDGKPRTHPERGLSYDVAFDGDGFELHWYLSTQTGLPSFPQADPDRAPVVLPGVIVRATMRDGAEVKLNFTGYNEGQIIAQGQTAPATLAMQATTGARWVEVDGRNVYEFVVPMKFEQKTVAKENGFSLRVDAFVDNPHCRDPAASGYAMPNLVRLHTSPDLRPRMQVPVLEPLRIEYLHPQFILDDLIVHAAANSPWGNYDVDEGAGGIELQILDASGRPAAPSLERGDVVQRTHDHGHHTEAVDLSYVWPYPKDKPPHGAYTIHLKVSNDQGTATAYATSRIELGEALKVSKCGSLDSEEPVTGCVDELQNSDGSVATAPPVKSPALQSLAVLGTLVLGASLRQRRRGPG